jgi:hypothetical protein
LWFRRWTALRMDDMLGFGVDKFREKYGDTIESEKKKTQKKKEKMQWPSAEKSSQR